MPQSDQTISAPPEWNLFAAELLRLLQAHGHASLWGLQKLGVYPSKIQRLIFSLKEPKSFPTLNPDELHRVCAALQCTDAEQRSLVATLLATIIEAGLMDRLHRDLAYQAAQRIVPVLLDALTLDAQTKGALAHIESGTRMDEETALAMLALSSAGIFSLVDRADFAFHASCTNRSTATAIDQAQQALSHLQKAQRLFLKLSPDVTTSEIGTAVQYEIQEEIVTINRHLNRLLAGEDE